jgi:hypothetical protein
MNNEFNAGAASVLLWLLSIAISIGTGIITWNMIEPDSFWTVVLFLFIWGIIIKIGYILIFGIITLLFK